MALMVKNGELPRDAVTLTREQALEYQLKLLWNWKPQSEVWPLRYGVGLLGLISGASGMFINNHYRNKLFLGQYGRISTYLPIVLLPGVMSSLFHHQFVSQELLLESTPCPVCLQTRAAAFQCSLGVLYPLIIAPLGNFMFATRHATFRLPYFNEPMKTLKLWIKMTRPIGTPLTFIFIGHAFSGAIMTYLEGKSYYRVQNKLMLLEEEYDSEINRQ